MLFLWNLLGYEEEEAEEAEDGHNVIIYILYRFFAQSSDHCAMIK
jgi:hypothetical protein